MSQDDSLGWQTTLPLKLEDGDLYIITTKTQHYFCNIITPFAFDLLTLRRSKSPASQLFRKEHFSSVHQFYISSRAIQFNTFLPNINIYGPLRTVSLSVNSRIVSNRSLIEIISKMGRVTCYRFIFLERNAEPQKIVMNKGATNRK